MNIGEQYFNSGELFMFLTKLQSVCLICNGSLSGYDFLADVQSFGDRVFREEKMSGRMIL